MKQGAQYWLAGLLGRRVLDAILGTMRVQVVSPEPTQPARPFIFALWHGRLLPLTYLHRNQGVSTLISRSADGEYIARIVERWGYQAIRGSSSRGGGTALREIVKAARAGKSIAVTPDGPRGPRQKLKRGVLTAAQLSGIPILPVSAGATRAWWIEGWDRFLVPKPFSRLYVHYGNLVYVPRDASEDQLVQIETDLEQALNRLTEQADADARRG
jgi:lysophospholipid acyltransferase (LPLAT)-like uncharacterized protein